MKYSCFYASLAMSETQGSTHNLFGKMNHMTPVDAKMVGRCGLTCTVPSLGCCIKENEHNLVCHMPSQLYMENIFFQLPNFIGKKTEAHEHKLYVQSHQDKRLQIQLGGTCSVSSCRVR